MNDFYPKQFSRLLIFETKSIYRSNAETNIEIIAVIPYSRAVIVEAYPRCGSTPLAWYALELTLVYSQSSSGSSRAIVLFLKWANVYVLVFTLL